SREGEEAIFRADEDLDAVGLFRRVEDVDDVALALKIVEQHPDALEIMRCGFIKKMAAAAHDQRGAFAAGELSDALADEPRRQIVERGLVGLDLFQDLIPRFADRPST